MEFAQTLINVFVYYIFSSFELVGYCGVIMQGPMADQSRLTPKPWPFAMLRLASLILTWQILPLGKLTTLTTTDTTTTSTTHDVDTKRCNLPVADQTTTEEPIKDRQEDRLPSLVPSSTSQSRPPATHQGNRRSCMQPCQLACASLFRALSSLLPGPGHLRLGSFSIRRPATHPSAVSVGRKQASARSGG